MTDPQTPATEAGRLDVLWNLLADDDDLLSSGLEARQKAIRRHRAAIEAEARADEHARLAETLGDYKAEARAEAYEDGFAAGRNDGSIYYKLGRADALREAADALDAVPYAPRLGFINRKRAKAAVLALLDPQ